MTTRSIYGAHGALLAHLRSDGTADLYLGHTTLHRTSSGTVTGTRTYNLAGATVAQRDASGLRWVGKEPDPLSRTPDLRR
ncbi:MAG: hypothetical protein ACTHK1_03990 [Actinomycetales bacterium]